MIANPIIIIFGPTASGKSALAMDIAGEFRGVVINADSMQVYKELRILTARPSVADEARVPHRLYGVLPAAEACSAGKWLSLAVPEIEAAWADGKLPIVCGGTGLYVRALMEGLNDIPEIDPVHREEARAQFAAIGPEAYQKLLATVDAKAADRIGSSDPQRMIRAYEVYLSTGRPLSEWQAAKPVAPLPARFYTITVAPERHDVYAACDARAEVMLDKGALDEVALLAAQDLDPALPAMKALGVPSLIEYLNGELDRAEALRRLQQATRNYAKRQITWLSHQIEFNFCLSAQYSERFRSEIFTKIRENVLTAQG